MRVKQGSVSGVVGSVVSLQHRAAWVRFLPREKYLIVVQSLSQRKAVANQLNVSLPMAFEIGIKF